MTTTEPATGFDPQFGASLMAMIAASNGRISIKSGFRSHEEQQALWDNAVAKYGEAGAPQWVARPGHSNHERGLAADLEGDIPLAHQLAPQFGLVFPMSWENWHIEPPHARDSSTPQAYSDAPAGAQNPVLDQGITQSPAWVAASIADAIKTATSLAPVGGLTPVDSLMPAHGTVPEDGSHTSTPMGHGGGAFGGVNSGKWASDFLTAAGKPVTPENLRAVEAWQQAESGGGGGRYNPLNTTQGGFAGETNLNSVGVKNYANYQDGIAANVRVLNNGRYQPILDALDRGNDAMAVARAVAQTPWGTGQGVVRVLNGG